MMMMAQSSPSNERLSISVLGGEDRIKPVRSGSLRKVVCVMCVPKPMPHAVYLFQRDRPQRQRQNSRKATTCLFLQPDDIHHEQESKLSQVDAQDREDSAIYISHKSLTEQDEKLMPTQNLRKAYSQPAVKQLQAELRHIVERALIDPSNDAAKTALERKHEEMEAMVQRQQAEDDVKVHYGRSLLARPDPNRRTRTEGSIPFGKSL